MEPINPEYLRALFKISNLCVIVGIFSSEILLWKKLLKSFSIIFKWYVDIEKIKEEKIKKEVNKEKAKEIILKLLLEILNLINGKNLVIHSI